ncbi:asparagine synthase (glutamine-hydrolyzing) [Paracoccaceae bacterium]|nr:asparagine synthase (glutamine-hydrolyzing) [Paracoccaceae bacterium]
MCGITGFWEVPSRPEKELNEMAQGMANTIAHRGPDDLGAWSDPEAGIALGHRRLSIIDLSPAGHQPMTSSSGRFVIAFNGEIYNHLELRTELNYSSNSNAVSGTSGAALKWRGHSDTETLLAAFERWGVAVTLSKTVGMFAIVLWDVHQRTLHLARDRFGEKPLYYGWTGSGDASTFVFGSELKSLCAFPRFVNPVCREALAQYMRFLYVPAPRSIYQGIYKLEPGCLLSIKGAAPMAAPPQPLRPTAVYQSVTLSRWWSLGNVVQLGAHNPITDEVDAVDALEQRLSAAVKMQSLADVPLGAFLSGGVDSSTIVALMQQQATCPVKTFTVGFEEYGFDEAPYARAVAKHLGTDHTEMFVTAAEAQEVIAQLPSMYDEPFADSSQIPMHLVCRAAREHVTVALSGDAGDELFGGYNRYFWGPRIWSKLAWLPYPVRYALGAAINAVPVVAWDALSLPVNTLLPNGQGIVNAGDKAHKLAARLSGVRDLDDLYMSLVSEWQDPAQVVRGENGCSVLEPSSQLSDGLPKGDLTGVANSPLRMMYRDSMTYLPDDILCKVDRAAMASSLETRVPFLDHRVAELAWQLPLGMKIMNRQGKWPLRQVLYKHVPRELIERPKAGFGIPVGQWLRGPLRPWAENLIDQNRLSAEGYFYSEPIRKKWAEHLSGRRDHTASLWAVLMFQAWVQQS